MEYNFDRVSAQYDASRAMPAAATERICRWVLSRLPDDPAVTEIGVGTGRIAVPFIERDVRYTGLDISEQMMTILRDKLEDDLHRAELFLADITDEWPVAPASQDAVVAVHILHLVDAEKALAQVRRALKPHGALVWGYQWSADDSPANRIRKRFRQEVAALGGPPRRDFMVQHGRELLATWGASAAQHVVATWVEPVAPAEVIANLRNRLMSMTWHLPDEVLAEAAARTEAWIRTEFGDPEREHDVDERFVVDWYQF